MDAIACFETRHERGGALPTHRHGRAYAALVLDGSHLESGVDGTFECTPGTLLLHPRFHAHGNRFGNGGARVVNIALPCGIAIDGFHALQVEHLGDAREVFRRSPESLAALVARARECEPVALPDWQGALVDGLAASEAPIGALCRHLGISPAHASRALLRSHGMAPQLLRRELHWRRALALLRGDDSLTEIAAACGFADQSHLTRVARAFTGLTPTQLRRQIKCVQDAFAPMPA